MAQHTPGPWSYSECDDYRDGGEIVARPPFQTIRVCQMPQWQAQPDEMRANATLIAAAPDMLAALKALHHQCEYMGAPATHPDMTAAAAAIAKATGQ